MRAREDAKPRSGLRTTTSAAVASQRTKSRTNKMDERGVVRLDFDAATARENQAKEQSLAKLFAPEAVEVMRQREVESLRAATK